MGSSKVNDGEIACMQNEQKDDLILDIILNDQKLNEGYRLLLAEYQEKLYWHVRRMVLSHEDADDVLQNAFIKVYRNIGGFQRKSSLYTWLYRIATNEALTFLKQKKRKQSQSINDLTAAQHEHLVADAYFDETHALRLLNRAVERLPEKQKLVFQMRYFEQMTYQQISGVLEKSEGGLKASFHHAVKKIEKFLIENQMNETSGNE